MKRSKALELARALESGKYKQGSGALHPTARTYCCLGVACRVAGKKFTVQSGEYRIDGESAVLPQSVMDYFGFQSATGRVKPSKEMALKTKYYKEVRFNVLTDANDAGVAFKEIARFIRKRWKDL